MTAALVLTVAAGALTAGFVSGLAGFGTGLVALGFWLHVMDPVLAAPLVVICSVVAQAQSLPRIRRAMNLARLWPFLLGGLVGVPLGVFALDHIEAETFRAVVGLFLVVYAGSMLPKGWTKDEQRAVFQPFNLSVLTWALIAQAAQGVLTEEVGALALVCLPGTLIGARIGILSYGRVNDRQFRRIVLWLLFASGVTLTVSNVF
jgi:uncharacterized membrane protein YfcA